MVRRISKPKATEATLPSYVIDRMIERSVARNVALIVAASLLIALAAQVRVPVPFSPVPMTMQPLAVLLVGAALGARRGSAAATLYLLEGAAGLPVFAHPLGLAGPTAGYLLAFPAGAWLSGWLAERGWTRTFSGSAAAMVPSLAVILLGGWLWLATAGGLGAGGAFVAGIAPFIAGDLIKIVLAALLLPVAQRFVRRRS